MRWAVVIAALLFAGAAVARTIPEAREADLPPATAGSVERGRMVVERNCRMCHAVGRIGESPMPSAPRLRELHFRYGVDLLPEALGEGLRTHPSMPEFQFDEADLNDIVAYLRSIQTHDIAGRLTAAPGPARGAGRQPG